MKRVVMGCNPYGCALEAIKHHLIERGIEVEDLGVHAAEMSGNGCKITGMGTMKVRPRMVQRGGRVSGRGCGY
jgi:ribose 5-phosphate isomerase RpiB